MLHKSFAFFVLSCFSFYCRFYIAGQYKNMQLQENANMDQVFIKKIKDKNYLNVANYLHIIDIGSFSLSKNEN